MGLACAVLLTVAACGGSEEDPVGKATSSAATTPAPEPSAQPAGDDPCDSVTEAASYVDLLVFANNMDDPDLGDRLAKAKAAFDSAPPAELAKDWKIVAEFFATVAPAFAGVDPTDGDQLRSAQATLDKGIEAQAAAADEAGGRIAAYAKSQCAMGSDTAAASTTDACDLLTDEELRKVFPADDPIAKGKDFGVGFLECIWKGKTAEASVMVMPLDKLKEDYLDKATPLSAVDGLENGNAYRGTIGIGRVSSRGHSVSFSDGDVGGFVSVRTGNGGSRVVDVPIASDLAKAAAGRL